MHFFLLLIDAQLVMIADRMFFLLQINTHGGDRSTKLDVELLFLAWFSENNVFTF